MQLRVFLSELKRRQVYRAIIVYATIAWVLLEGADIVFPRLGFADESIMLVLTLVCIGFPVALYLAWVFDITPDGIFRTPPLTPGTSHHFSWIRLAELFLIGGLIMAVGYLYLDRLSLQKQILEPTTSENSEIEVPDPAQYRSIAVLPFADMSESGDQAWFAEGIAEELLLALSKVEPLAVVARTSSFAFKDTDKTVAEIAAILDVKAVLEGSVRRSGDRVRISAQLIDASSGYHIWSGSYQRDLTDIFELQDELARGIVHALRIELGVESVEPLIAEQTKSLEAYNWFIRGRALMDWGNPKNTLKSIECFEKAVELDPDYAQAWGWLAFSRAGMSYFRPTALAAPAAIEAYRRALELEPEQSEALTAKAWITRILDWDFDAALELYQRALKAKDNTNAMVTYNMFLWTIDLQETAIRNQRAIEQRDPLHAGYKATLANFMLYWTGDAEAAAAKAREALELNPQHIFALYAFIDANALLGNYTEVDKQLGSLSQEILNWPPIKCRIGIYHALSGNVDLARQIYDQLMRDESSANFPFLAHLALRLGEVEAAIDVMERGIAANTWHASAIRDQFIIRQYEEVNNHPRYLALLEGIGLDDESVAELHDKFALD
jgi:TolB-like protein/Tfp pilus assembly protein PilF